MKSLCTKCVVSLFILCMWFHASYGGGNYPATRLDGSSFIASVWQYTDSESGTSKIQATYASSTTMPTPIDLTNPTEVSALKPSLAIAGDPTAPITAVAAWKAFDFHTSNYIIQVSTAIAGAPPIWNTAPKTISINDSGELPGDVLSVTISNDGKTISVMWNAFLYSINDTIIRQNISNDGGETWLSSPYKF